MVQTHVQWDGGTGFKVHPLDDGEDFLLPDFSADEISDNHRNLKQDIKRYQERV